MIVDDRRHDHIERNGKVAPKEQTVRRVEWLPSEFITTYHRVFEITEVGVEVVQIAQRLRANVREENVASFLKTKARQSLKLAIA